MFRPNNAITEINVIGKLFLSFWVNVACFDVYGHDLYQSPNDLCNIFNLNIWGINVQLMYI